MSVKYTWVQWNKHKRVYDLAVALAVVAFVGVFFAGSKLLAPPPEAVSDEIVLMRGLGVAAFVLLHVILCIGPLARLDRRFAPLLYNRRHLGVTMFLISLVHAVVAIGYYGGFGVENPLVTLLARSPVGSAGVPFELLGFAALAILFLMAATSHDFWLKNLTPRTWKSLHMLVYVAYVLLVLHVAFGALHAEPSPVYFVLLGTGFVVIAALHLIAGTREARLDAAALPAGTGESAKPDTANGSGTGSAAGSAAGPASASGSESWIDVASADEIPESRAKVVCLREGERVAIFKHEGKLSAMSNVCAHQGGPLGEGKIVGGCVTCPWHGYQYLPHNGQSPPPYTEKIPTYQVRVVAGRVLLNPEALPPGTPTEPSPAGANP
ncbi:MAG: ferric reductase-like transmembrane domain-containing protein [Planctomycetota bacterium]|nr:ferric reductase-like transmembrane domain-containing protein [Planctomycetota bacterium]